MPWSSFRGHVFTRFGGQQYGQSRIKTLIVSRLSGDMMGQFTDHLPPMSPLFSLSLASLSTYGSLLCQGHAAGPASPAGGWNWNSLICSHSSCTSSFWLCFSTSVGRVMLCVELCPCGSSSRDCRAALGPVGSQTFLLCDVACLESLFSSLFNREHERFLQ